MGILFLLVDSRQNDTGVSDTIMFLECDLL